MYIRVENSPKFHFEVRVLTFGGVLGVSRGFRKHFRKFQGGFNVFRWRYFRVVFESFVGWGYTTTEGVSESFQWHFR